MMTELVIDTDRVQKFLDDIETQKNILSKCTNLYTTLSNRFTSLQESISLKSQSLQSKIQALEANARETLQSLDQRENSIPERESAAAALVEEHKETALAELQKPISGDAGLSEILKSHSRKMDSSGLLSFIVSKRKESVTLRTELPSAIAEAVDPPRLVLEAVGWFLNCKLEKSGVTDKRWACGILIQALFPDYCVHDKGPEFSRSIVDRAAGVLDKWKAQMDSDSRSGSLVAAEVVMFLQMVVGFRLKERFEEQYLSKLVIEFAGRRDMAKLAAALKFGEKMGDIIDDLVKNGKEIEAVYFASESGLTESFSPINLLKSYLQNSKKSASSILKKENNSLAAKEESMNMELHSIKSIIKCVEDHKLESEFNIESLKKRASNLEKVKAERKKISGGSSKSQNKRASGSSGGRDSGLSFRPAKAAKFSNGYSSFIQRNAVPPPQPSPARRFSGPYNFPVQTVYDIPAANPFPTTYPAAINQSPSSVTPQYSLSSDNIGSASYMSGACYAGHASYVPYDYGSTAAGSYQPPSYGQ